jgi:hypothetical protein
MRRLNRRWLDSIAFSLHAILVDSPLISLLLIIVGCSTDERQCEAEHDTTRLFSRSLRFHLRLVFTNECIERDLIHRFSRWGRFPVIQVERAATAQRTHMANRSRLISPM